MRYTIQFEHLSLEQDWNLKLVDVANGRDVKCDLQTRSGERGHRWELS